MTTTAIHDDALDIRNLFSCNSLIVRSGRLGSASFDSNDYLLATKVIHQNVITYTQSIGASLVDEVGYPIYIFKSVGELITFRVTPLIAPLDAATCTFDLQKSTAAGAFSSILDSVVTLNSSSVDRTSQSGTFSATPTIANDIFQVVVNETTGGGTQGLGVLVTLVVREEP